LKKIFKSKKVIVGTFLILVILFIVIHKSSKVAKAKEEVSTILLSKSDVFIVNVGSVASVVPFTGDLSPLNQTAISSEVTAVASKVLVKAGEYVKKEQVLAILDDTELKEAMIEQEAQLATAKSQFQLDKTKLDREKELYEQGFISKFAYDELKTNYQASLQKINQQQASLKRSKKQLSNTIIKAPFSGYVYQKFIDAGQLTNQNSKLFSLADLSVMEITASIPGDRINEINPGKDASFQVETQKQIYVGQIDRVNPVAQSGTRSYFIYIKFNNLVYQLKAGQFVKGQIVVKQLNNINYIPKRGIRYANNKPYVLILSNGKIVEKPIIIMIENKILGVSGVSGLKVGDLVVSGNINTLNVGDKAAIED